MSKLVEYPPSLTLINEKNSRTEKVNRSHESFSLFSRIFSIFLDPKRSLERKAGSPLGVPGAEDVAKGPNKMENNS